MAKKTVVVRIDERTFEALKTLGELLGVTLSEAVRQCLPADQLNVIIGHLDSDPSLNFKHLMRTAIQNKIDALISTNSSPEVREDAGDGAGH